MSRPDHPRPARPWDAPLTRRRFLLGSAAAAAGLAGLGLPACGDDDDDDESPQPEGAEPERSDVFDAGVAAGAVREDSAVLWVHTNREESITGQIALSEDFAAIVNQADFSTREDRALNAQWRVDGLAPDTRYFYRFVNGSESSRVGTLTTAPAGDQARSFSFVLSGDSDGTRIDGTASYNEFETLAAAADDKPGLFLYIGDTVYADSGAGEVAETLDAYQAKYQENRGYDALRDLLAVAPVVAMFDDHEIHSDFAGQRDDSARYVAAVRAFSDYFPLAAERPDWDSASGPTDGPRFYHSFSWGAAAEFFILDGRSYRSGKAEGRCILGDAGPDRFPTLGRDAPSEGGRELRRLVGHPEETNRDCLAAIDDPERTLLGADQKSWFKEALRGSTARFKFVVNSVPIQQVFVQPYDRWEGFAAERREILEFIRDEGIENVIFLSTDLHGNLINDVYIDVLEGGDPIAREVVAGPVATGTFRKKIVDFIGEENLDAYVEFAREAGRTRAMQIDIFAYALISVDAERDAVKVTFKNERGEMIYEEALAALAQPSLTA